jgi:hypothetical protein
VTCALCLHSPCQPAHRSHQPTALLARARFAHLTRALLPRTERQVARERITISSHSSPPGVFQPRSPCQPQSLAIPSTRGVCHSPSGDSFGRLGRRWPLTVKRRESPLPTRTAGCFPAKPPQRGSGGLRLEGRRGVDHSASSTRSVIARQADAIFASG